MLREAAAAEPSCGSGAELGQRWCRGAGAMEGQAGRSGRAAGCTGSVADLAQRARGGSGRAASWRRGLDAVAGLLLRTEVGSG